MKDIKKEVGEWDLQVYKLWNESQNKEDFAEKLQSLLSQFNDKQKEAVGDLTLALYHFVKGTTEPELRLRTTQKEVVQIFAQLWKNGDEWRWFSNLNLLPDRVKALESLKGLDPELRRLAWYVALSGCDTRDVVSSLVSGEIGSAQKAPEMHFFANCCILKSILRAEEFNPGETIRSPVSYKEFARRFPGSDWFGQAWLLKDVIMSGLIDE